jgi:curved DNA-binding protein CbpA
LGVPGNASPEEIEAAYLRCNGYFSTERLATDPKAVERQKEVIDAYRLLNNPEFRAAYDRKLTTALKQAPTRPPVVILEKEEVAWYAKPIMVMSVALVFMLGAGVYISYSRAQDRKIQAERELAQKKQEAEEALQVQRKRELAEAERLRQLAENERRERQLQTEASYAVRAAAQADAQRQSAATRHLELEQREAQRRAQEARNEERQRVQEAERRAAQDRQKIRDLCFQNYRRPDC